MAGKRKRDWEEGKRKSMREKPICDTHADEEPSEEHRAPNEEQQPREEQEQEHRAPNGFANGFANVDQEPRRDYPPFSTPTKAKISLLLADLSVLCYKSVFGSLS
jgi:hypothetical protein